MPDREGIDFYLSRVHFARPHVMADGDIAYEGGRGVTHTRRASRISILRRPATLRCRIIITIQRYYYDIRNRLTSFPLSMPLATILK